MKIEVIYYSGSKCGVCQVLKPKVFEAIKLNHPKVDLREVNIQSEPEFAAQNMVFTLPVVQILVDGKEQYRFARSFAVHEVLNKLKRIYELSS
jgi:thioredoxin-like negative regulator of GroEL